ncbi:MAG TPA: CAP domain-containing protein [Solirubrobacteraceae bacterium]|nr:CAP domain-containing protein [Solirubrobacteraceae bacterium]
MLATPCQNTEAAPSAANVDLVRAAVLCLINRARAQRSETPLTISPDLQRAAELHTAEMISEDYFDHVSPAGSTPVTRATSEGYIPNALVGYVIGENLAWGTLSLATPEAIVAAWMASPGHRANILEAAYLETGIDVAPQVPVPFGEGAPGATYTQEFGVIIR